MTLAVDSLPVAVPRSTTVGMNRWVERQSGRRLFLAVWVGYSVGWAAMTMVVCLAASAAAHRSFYGPPPWVSPLDLLGSAGLAAWMVRRIKRV